MAVNASAKIGAKEGVLGPAGLRFFTTRILANLEPSRDRKLLTQGPWNNVVPYKEHERHYGRNFAIGTGRAKVLHADAQSNQFDGLRDFTVYQDVSPTEQIFFSLFALVRDRDGVYDVFSKEKIEKKRMADIRRIESVGWVKIVLYYQVRPGGYCQLSECFVDGLRVPVIERPPQKRP